MVKRFFAVFGSEISNLHEAAYLLALFALISQILGLIGDRILAYMFGAGHTLDLFYASFRIPDLIYATIASTVSASVLIPFLIEHFNKGEKNGKDFIDSVFTVFFGAMVIVSMVAYILAPWLVKTFLPGFAHDADFGQLVTGMRIMLFSPFFLGLSNFFSGVTQMNRRFLIYSLSPSLYNLGIIVGAVFFYRYLGLAGLVWGVALGACLHMAIQIPFIIRTRTFPRFVRQVDWPSVRRVVFLSLPRTLTLSANQLASFFLIALASFMAGGSISIFNFANSIESVPLTIIGVSYSSAAFPTLSKLFSVGKIEEFLREVAVSARHIIFWSLPVTALFIVLRANIVRVILGAGAFDWNDTRLTAAALALFIISIVGQGLILLYVRAYYSQGLTRKPLIINIFSAVLIAGLGYFLDKAYYAWPMFQYFIQALLKVSDQPGAGVLMLPLAFSIGAIVNTALHWYIFDRDFPGFSKRLGDVIFQSLSSAVIGGYAAYLGLRFFNLFFPLTTTFNVFMQGFLAGLFGIAVCIAVFILMKSPEIVEVWHTLHTKIWKAKIVAPDPKEV
ncbi:MAG: murein biosynthesis integral membrane protein MurJ [Candidatus Pacebacteria bacterium]|nr:murein biosynthesis integral membrane protein MurJ [Candidatus Paceibacterota bacterium]